MRVSWAFEPLSDRGQRITIRDWDSLYVIIMKENVVKSARLVLENGYEAGHRYSGRRGLRGEGLYRGDRDNGTARQHSCPILGHYRRRVYVSRRLQFI
jgi:hypothetical protein